MRYFASGNLFNEVGPLKMPDFAQQRLDSLNIPILDHWMHPEALQLTNVRANLTATVSPKFDLSVNTGFSQSRTSARRRRTTTSIGIWSAAYYLIRASRHAGLGYTNVGALGETLYGYNRWIPSEIFQQTTTVDIQRMTGSADAQWRPFTWMQNDGTVGIDLLDRTQFGLCRLDECPNSGTIRQGSVSSTTRTTTATSRRR